MNKDCFAFREIGKSRMCLALEFMQCVNGECKFYKKDGTQCDTCLKKGNTSTCKQCKMIRQRGNKHVEM